MLEICLIGKYRIGFGPHGKHGIVEQNIGDVMAILRIHIADAARVVRVVMEVGPIGLM